MNMEWADGKIRCQWANPKNERYIRYHDEEWGVPVYDDHKLFEMLVLESFQAGLSWECVLNKRESFRKAFDNFDLEKVCGYDEERMERLRENPDIIRNKRKIQSAVINAGIFRSIQKEFGSFSEYIWGPPKRALPLAYKHHRSALPPSPAGVSMGIPPKYCNQDINTNRALCLW